MYLLEILETNFQDNQKWKTVFAELTGNIRLPESLFIPRRCMRGAIIAGKELS
jgi:hypothetical protein